MNICENRKHNPINTQGAWFYKFNKKFELLYMV